MRKAIRACRVEIDQGHLFWQQGAACCIAKCKSYLRIVQDKRDGLLRKFNVRWDCDKPCAHDGEVRDQYLGAVERKDRDPVAAREAFGHERSRARIYLPVDLAVRQYARMVPIETVDQCRMRLSCIVIAEIAKVEKIAHVELLNTGSMR